MKKLRGPGLRVDQEDLVGASGEFSVKVDEHGRNEVALGRQVLDDTPCPFGSAKCALPGVCMRSSEPVRLVTLQEMQFVDL